MDEDGYIIASCSVLVGCYSYGKTLEEASKNIKEDIELCIESGDVPNSFIGYKELEIA